AKFRDRAPHVVRDPKRGDLFVIEGLDKPIPMGLVAAAGKGAGDLRGFGVGQTAMGSVEDGIPDLERIKALGLRGVMMPGNPALADYDDPMYDPFWEAAVDLKLPLSFHILTSSSDTFKTRGPKLNAFMSIIRGCQDII